MFESKSKIILSLDKEMSRSAVERSNFIYSFIINFLPSILSTVITKTACLKTKMDLSEMP